MTFPIVALIPARGGSKRVPKKNTRLLAGHPLIAYTIAAARESGVFDDVVVSSDDVNILSTAASYYGASVVLRPPEYATDDAPDILWVRHALDTLKNYPAFAILRPTSPFRSAETIRRAHRRFSDVGGDCHSLRAVERVRQHPYKMWTISEKGSSPTLWMRPFSDECGGRLVDSERDYPWSRPTQTLYEVYVQNASLEIAWSANVYQRGSISGTRIVPFFTEGHEGLDINRMEDFILAEALVERDLATLPTVVRSEILEIVT